MSVRLIVKFNYLIMPLICITWYLLLVPIICYCYIVLFWSVNLLFFSSWINVQGMRDNKKKISMH